jgi:membrane-associated protein
MFLFKEKDNIVEWLQEGLSFFLHIDQHLIYYNQLLGAWIYVLLFIVVFCETGLVVTPFLPGDSLLFVIGAFAGAGHIHPIGIGLTLWVAAVLGDTVNYSIGMKLGKGVFHRGYRFLKPEYLIQTEQFYEKHGAFTIVMARFVPLIRTFAPFVAGVGHMKYKKFMLYNVGGATAWIVIFISLGYFFGHLPWIQKNLSLVIVGIVVLSVIPAIVEWLKHRFPENIYFLASLKKRK